MLKEPEPGAAAGTPSLRRRLTSKICARRPTYTEATITLRLGGALALTQLARIGCSVTDTVMIGWLGAVELSAAALINAIVTLLYITAFGVLQGLAPIAGSLLGAGQHGSVGKAFRQTLVIACALAIFMGAVTTGIPWFLALIGQEPRLVELGAPYALALVPGFLPLLWFTVMRLILASVDDAKWLTAIALVALPFNAAANYLMMYGGLGVPGLGLVGVGIATSLTDCLSFALALLAVTVSKYRVRLQLFVSDWRPDRRSIREILALGLPIGAILFIEMTLLAVCGVLMGYVGIKALAAHAIVMQWLEVFLVMAVGLSHAATIRVATAYGANAPEQIRSAYMSAFLACGVLTGVGALLFAAIPEEMLMLLARLQPEERAIVVDIGAGLMRVAAVTLVVGGFVVVMAGVLRGFQESASSLTAVAVGYWGVGILAAAALGFPFGLGALGIWLGMSLGFAVSLLTLTRRFSTKLRAEAASWNA